MTEYRYVKDINKDPRVQLRQLNVPVIGEVLIETSRDADGSWVWFKSSSYRNCLPTWALGEYLVEEHKEFNDKLEDLLK